MQLELSKNDTVRVKLSFVDSAIKVTLLAAEMNGIWIDARALREVLSSSAGCASVVEEVARSGADGAIFVPFAHVEFLLKDLSTSP